jgi:hypothetical protein
MSTLPNTDPLIFRFLDGKDYQGWKCRPRDIDRYELIFFCPERKIEFEVSDEKLLSTLGEQDQSFWLDRCSAIARAKIEIEVSGMPTQVLTPMQEKAVASIDLRPMPPAVSTLWTLA